MMTKVKCPVCNKNNALHKAIIPGYKEGEKFEVKECRECESSFIHPHQSNEEIYQLIYRHAEEVPGYSRYFHYANAVLKTNEPLDLLANSEAMYWAVWKTMKDQNIGQNAEILEVGCGLGYLTYSLAKKGYNIRGVDISANAIRSANEKFGPYYTCMNIFEAGNEFQNRYELVILTEVIEHVEDPVAFISCLKGMLKHGGKLLITTPNKSVAYKNSVWDTELPPVHLSWFSERSMNVVAARTNTQVTFINFSEFNNKNFDVVRFKIYKPLNREPILKKDGELTYKAGYREDRWHVKIAKSILLFLCRFKGFEQLLTRKEFPKTKSSTLGVLFTKNI